MATERKTVTLFLYLPKAKKVILSRRGKLEKKAGLLQATVHGQIEPGEISQLAMKRELEEEVKGDFHRLTNIIDLGDAVVGETTTEHTFYHAAMMPDDLFSTLQPTQEVAEFVLVSEEEVKNITPYSKTSKQEDFDYSANLVMFDDELDVLKKVFKEYKGM
jgi:hypothetical protein